MATFWIATSLSLLAMTSGVAGAAINIPFTINLSKAVTVTGTPRIAVDVGGNQRFANYTSGTGTNALTFTLSPNIGDVDLDGVTVSSPIDLNGGTIKDTSGNDATLTFTPPNTSGIKINYPSLGMDFTNGTSGRYTLNGTVYNDISSFLTASGGTFSRNSIATYFDSTGTLQTAAANTPRFDYDPVTHQPKGILIEESRTNLLKNSSELSGWVSGGSPIITSNCTLSPALDMTADSLSTYATNVIQGISAPASTTYTFSVYGKKNTSSSFGFELHDSTGQIGIASFHFDTLSVSGSIPIKAVSSVGNGWYRLSATVTTRAGSSILRSYLYGGADYGHSGESYIWGVQLEQGASLTSYIPTTTAAVTRAADLFSLPKGSWFDETQGTILAHSFHNDSGNYRRIVGLSPTNKTLLSTGIDRSTLQTWAGVSGVVLDAPISAGPLSQTQSGRVALSWNASLSTRSLVANGATPVTESPYLGNYTTTNILLGSGLYPSDYLDSSIKKINYYPLRISPSQLQLLTQ